MITNGIVLILACLGLFQALFLAFYIITLKKGNRRANIYLGLVLIGLTIRITKSVLNNYMPLEAWQRDLGIAGIFIVGPFLWQYGKELMIKDRKPSWTEHLHLLPLIIFLAFLNQIPSGSVYSGYWNYGLVVLHLSIYLILSWRMLIKRSDSTSARIYIWYRNLLVGSSMVCIYYLGNFYGIVPFYISGPIFYTFLIYAFSYLLLKRHVFVLEKYGSSGLNKNTSKELIEKIRTLFEQENYHLDSNLSLASIGEKLSISSRDVSRIINENENKNFYDFVNHFRIESAKAKLSDSSQSNVKIATIAYDSGFNNVTSFNLAFKKEMGMTPSNYRVSQLENGKSF